MGESQCRDFFTLCSLSWDRCLNLWLALILCHFHLLKTGLTRFDLYSDTVPIPMVSGLPLTSSSSKVPSGLGFMRQLWLVFLIGHKVGEELFIKHHFYVLCGYFRLANLHIIVQWSIIDFALWNSNLCSSQKVWQNLTHNDYSAMDFFLTNSQNLIKYWEVISQEGSRTWNGRMNLPLVAYIVFI